MLRTWVSTPWPPSAFASAQLPGRGGVQEREQAGQRLVRVDRGIGGPAAEQAPLPGDGQGAGVGPACRAHGEECLQADGPGSPGDAGHHQR